TEIRRFLLPLFKKEKIHCEDLGDITPSLKCTSHDPRKKCAINIEELQKETAAAIQHNKIFSPDTKNFPVLLGGDHSVNIPFIRAAAKKAAAKKQKIGLLWLDAHGDFNTPQTTSSGNVHGMVVSQLTGLWGVGSANKSVAPENICLIGTRSLDPEEKKLLKKSGISVLTAKHVKRVGLKKALQKAAKIALNGTSGIHVSIDLDVFDPSIAPGVGTPVKKGFMGKQIANMCEIFATLPVVSMDVVELNPTRDVKNKTAKLAAELISAFCKKV
ncbi:MAG TPA: arginase, partial [Candidatus Gracilibacteria bacterium]|nr:arginase [Candidatus Gracilibacteria bacterium]